MIEMTIPAVELARPHSARGRYRLGTLYRDENNDAAYRFVQNTGGGPLVPRRACFYPQTNLAASPPVNGFRSGSVVPAGTAGAGFAAGHTLVPLAVGECGFIQVWGLQAPPDPFLIGGTPTPLPAALQNLWRFVPYPVGCDMSTAITPPTAGGTLSYLLSATVQAADGLYAVRNAGRQVAVVDGADMPNNLLAGAGGLVALRLRYEWE